jgi:Domain of unknown function (DUF222)
MFEGSLPEIGDLAGLDAAGLVDAAGEWARAENAACARKQAVMAEIFTRRTGLPAGERELWWVDPEAAVAAELAAALNVTPSLALHQTHRGVALRDRLPRVAALFEAGLISDLLVRAIVWRTYLIIDEEAMAAVDADLAAQVSRWGPLSITKTEAAIDALVDHYDPAALRRSRASESSRTLEFGSPSDAPGMSSMWARMYAPDAALIQQRVEQMARSVCEADPRTLAERRADALVALAAGTELACACGQSDCPAAGRDAPPKYAVVHVVADAATVDAAQATEPTPDPPKSTGPADTSAPAPTDIAAPVPAEPIDAAGESVEPDAAGTAQTGGVPAAFAPARAASVDPPSVPLAACQPGIPQPHVEASNLKSFLTPPAATAVPAPSCSAPPAFVIGGGIMPAPLLGATLERATIREIRHPGDAPPETGYRPSRALDEFVRCRDLTCRWPGCDKPAYGCDLDHTVPYPVGPTHASNMKCYCRFHHLLKTFWIGAGGWRERQLPDATIMLTSPTGHTYTTRPGSALLFPALCLPTAALWLPGQEPTVESSGDRGVMMPKRRHTRAHNRQRSVAAERRLNDAHVAERNKPPPF